MDPAMSVFVCPACGGHHYERSSDGVYYCHDERGIGCRWHGEDELSDARGIAEILRRGGHPERLTGTVKRT